MQMIPIKSSNIKAAGYEFGILRIRFGNDTEYDYRGVGVETFNEFMEAKSQGKFFHKNIKSQHAGKKVEKETGDGQMR